MLTEGNNIKNNRLGAYELLVLLRLQFFAEIYDI